MDIAIVAITSRGAELARRLARDLPGSEVHLSERSREDDGCTYFSEPLRDVLPRLFDRHRALVCIMATGIVVRLLAPHLKGKGTDPAVVVVDEAGEFAVSLLSGHLGGANDLAREIARISGATAVITTATDVNALPAWDEVARHAGLVVEPVSHLRILNALLLRGEPIALVDRRERILSRFAQVPEVIPCSSFASALRSGAAGFVFVTHWNVPRLEEQFNLLVLRPRDLVVGIGCNRGTTAEEIEGAVREELAAASLAFGSIACVATVDAKTDEAGITGFAARHALPVEYHSADALNAVDVPGPPSPHALAAVGAKGVCEPAAVLSAGGGSLLMRKRKRGNVTVAVAEKHSI